MYDLIVRIVVRKFILASVAFTFAGCLSDLGFGNGNVDLTKATWLVAEKVPLIRDKGGLPGLPTPPIVPIDNLFSLPPGTKVSVKALGGAIDPTGTNILNDFDGDGIQNANETTTNVWVADYPMIDTIIAPPVTMKIAIELNSSQQADEIISEIGSQDFASTRNEGSEKIHQNELNLKTVQFQDTYSDSISLNSASSFSESMGAKWQGTGANYGTSSSKNWGVTASTSKTLTKWADKPFVNNLDREAWSVKANSSSDKAMKYRRDKAAKVSTTSKVNPNAGYVRAALYIENQTVNMPVKIKNILCSLMFETGEGDLIPIQSFRLLNSDFSPFEVSVYGGTKFGPYVIELSTLNTAEVEKAIASGYTPKIYIVDYEMTHVPDSNYRSSLLNFTGDNLKIVEENSKARTALVKIFGPGFREMYRVAAFDAGVADVDLCNTTSVSTNLSPGITLRNALKRIECSGLEITYENVAVDMQEVAPKLNSSRIFASSIKSIGGIKNTVPCEPGDLEYTGSDGVKRKACIQKPISAWTEEEKNNAGFWVVFSKGKYYNFTEYVLFGSNKETAIFDPASPRPASVLKGIDSMIWAGDTIEIVYISMRDYGAKLRDFGTNPLVTNLPFKLNTAWDLASLGDHTYYPNTNSVYLGAVGFGEQIELTIKLDKTQYLNPSFGVPSSTSPLQYFTDFSYNRITSSLLFERTEMADFEISMGFGAQRTDWMHIEKDLGSSDPYKLQSCGVTFSHATQTLKLCVKLPTQHDVLDVETSVVELYIRPALNNAYRRTVWPLAYSKVGKMRGTLADAIVGANNSLTIRVMKPYGLIEKNDVLQIGNNPQTFSVVNFSTTPDTDGGVSIQLDQPVTFSADKTTTVITQSGLTQADVKITQDTGFIAKWNLETTNPTSYTTAQNLPFRANSSVSCTTEAKHPLGCLGFYPDFNAINWMGNYNQGVALWSSWADGGDFDGFLSNGLFGLATSNSLVYRLEAGASDYIVGEHTGSNPLSNPQTVTYNDYTLVIWKKDGDIWGRMYTTSTQQPLAAQFDMNSASMNIGTNGKFVAKVNENGKVILVWENGNDIFVNFWNMTTATPTKIGTDSKVVTRPYEVGGLFIDAAIGTSRAVVVYNQSYVTQVLDYIAIWTRHDAVARVYDATTGNPVAATFIYAYREDAAGRGKMVVAASATGNYALLSGYATFDAYGVAYHQAYNLSTPANVGSLNTVNDVGGYTNSIRSVAYSVGGTNPYAMTLWRTNSGFLNGAGVNLTTGALVKPAFRVDPNTVTNSWNVSANQNQGLVLYSTIADNAMRMKVLSLSDGQLAYNTSLVLNSNSSATGRNAGSAVLNGKNALATWEHVEGAKSTIRGRVAILDDSTVDKFFLKGSGEFFLSTLNQGAQTGAVVSTLQNSNFAMAFWLSQDALQPRIRGFNVNLLNPGTLQYGLNNFFVSPLIERDYTIISKIKF
ncbi:LIC12048 family lipoprotein [Leptospira saintgironsiae]|uniref:Lipoprotein n=1 Tax=Leptospira saintgironsiae TaxID=2023183 RepID=A0A2M9Y980_9LEPT|nr:LIC12048 family lipoprotein [Leptospira saintgironsiae]PJZ48009.1 hypothetical protein CH362_15920 [Leptospira saintgironsiae]